MAVSSMLMVVVVSVLMLVMVGLLFLRLYCIGLHREQKVNYSRARNKATTNHKSVAYLHHDNTGSRGSCRSRSRESNRLSTLLLCLSSLHWQYRTIK